MILCRVLGNAVSPVQHPSYEGRIVLVCKPISDTGASAGPAFLAVDAVQAGEGDRVLVAREGNAARQILGESSDPFHSVVLAVVDEVRRA